MKAGPGRRGCICIGPRHCSITRRQASRPLTKRGRHRVVHVGAYTASGRRVGVVVDFWTIEGQTRHAAGRAQGPVFTVVPVSLRVGIPVTFREAVVLLAHRRTPCGVVEPRSTQSAVVTGGAGGCRPPVPSSFLFGLSLRPGGDLESPSRGRTKDRVALSVIVRGSSGFCPVRSTTRKQVASVMRPSQTEGVRRSVRPPCSSRRRGGSGSPCHSRCA